MVSATFSSDPLNLQSDHDQREERGVEVPVDFPSYDNKLVQGELGSRPCIFGSTAVLRSIHLYINQPNKTGIGLQPCEIIRGLQTIALLCGHQTLYIEHLPFTYVVSLL